MSTKFLFNSGSHLSIPLFLRGLGVRLAEGSAGGFWMASFYPHHKPEKRCSKRRNSANENFFMNDICTKYKVKIIGNF